jgi:hypothetical protein
MQHAALIKCGHGCELRREQCCTVEIEIAAPEIGEALPEIGGGVAHTDTAANYDGTQSASPFSDVASALTKSETYKRVVKTLMGEGLSADAAWTAIHRLERKESIGW